MATVKVERESEEYLQVTVTTDADPTGNVVEFAFPTPGERPATFTAGVWKLGSAVQSGVNWKAVAQTPVIGTGSLDLDAGTYDAYLRIQGGAETPVIKLNRVRVA